jgi:hypothetical protein
VRAASQAPDLPTEKIVDTLCSHEFDAHRDRVRELVETTRQRIDREANADSDAVEEPRTAVPRFLGIEDVEYLNTRDFALVLGAVLSRYEGSWRTPDAVDDLAVDLFWNRQAKTVAFRTPVRPVGTPIEASVVDAVANGDTSPPEGRSPSVLGVVSNTGFTTDARDRAGEHGIELFGPPQLRRWFGDTQLTLETLGTLLEERERKATELEDVLADLQPVPGSVADVDPLAEAHEHELAVSNDRPAGSSGVDQGPPVTDDRPAPGQQGELYADPREDGDFTSFDRFAEELTMEDQ